jgi:type III secretory pathway component EscS
MVYVVDALEGYYARWMQINGVMEKISYNILLVFLLTGTVLAGRIVGISISINSWKIRHQKNTIQGQIYILIGKVCIIDCGLWISSS